MVEATIEDSAIINRSLRESGADRRRCCIEHDFANGAEMWANTGTEDKKREKERRRAQFSAAEKSG
jgi:hypothetical protein